MQESVAMLVMVSTFLAYAYDIVLIASSSTGLRRLLDIVIARSSKIDMICRNQ